MKSHEYLTNNEVSILAGGMVTDELTANDSELLTKLALQAEDESRIILVDTETIKLTTSLTDPDIEVSLQNLFNKGFLSINYAQGVKGYIINERLIFNRQGDLMKTLPVYVKAKYYFS